MPDYLHLILEESDDADCKAFIKLAKQYSSYYYKRSRGTQLWQRYGYDRVIRDDMVLAMTVRYVIANPVRWDLVKHPRDYAFLGSTKYTVEELLQSCEYSEAVL